MLFGGQNFGNDVTVRPLSLGYAGSAPSTAGADASVAADAGAQRARAAAAAAPPISRARALAPRPATRCCAFPAALTRALAGDWQARLLLNGQLTRDALVPGEQFGAGGGATVRGFDERDLSPDSGVLANAGTVHAEPVHARAGVAVPRAGLRRCRARHAQPRAAGRTAQRHVASVGLGLRLALRRPAQPAARLRPCAVNAGAIHGAGKDKLHVPRGLPTENREDNDA